MTTSLSAAETKKGVIFALAAYGSWGLFPAFWRLMAELPPPEVLAYRVVWTLVMVLVLVGLDRRWGEVLTLLGKRRQVLILAASTLCISTNWLVFIWVVGSGNVLEASMGYFLNPLVNVGLGVLVLGERLRKMQWLAVAIAAAGIVHLSLSTGTPPWAALFLAATFGVYGLLRKILPVAPLTGLAVETALMLPFALAYLGWRLAEGAPFMGGSWPLATALLACGPVTALPLLWFAAAASRMRYSTLGFFQYLAPTGHFLLAVLAYGENAEAARMLAFAGIWTAIALYSADSWAFARRNRSEAGRSR
ncbi:permease [Paramagnetospirillum marisnigri]|uniref:Permease n=1 Tax=Paramagnetospirillum marisnigri TaxID=1285242 RepID=A0A178MQJ6_9PROT|nr:EamA family transporter RarD [Paramagnetospirillum marisnigri]OAN51073.1 permease [Paramagnetospirillum marisnigri]